MMTKKRSSIVTNLKIFLVLPVALMIMLAFSSCDKSNKPSVSTTEIAPLSSSEPVYDKVDVMPLFPGGDTALMNFVSKNITYPDEAKKNNVQGKVIARFCVTTKGTVDRIQIINGVSKELDDEAVRVIKMFPRWTPGQKDGKSVNVWYNLPITYRLN
jgi:protein TonB